MLVELTYEGRVFVNGGVYKGYNGIKIGHCVNYDTREWLCLVEFYEGGDIEAIPFEYIEKIDLAGRI